MSAAPRAASRASVSGAWPVVDESEVSVGALLSRPASAGEVTGGMAPIVMGRYESCGRIREAVRPAPIECTHAVSAVAVVPWASHSGARV